MDYLRPAEFVDDKGLRDAYDMLPSGYYRYSIDRDITLPQGEFWRFDSIGLLEAGRQQYEQDGRLNILDAGCGTGHQVWHFADHVAWQKHIPRSDITATGVSNIDFSGESELWRVRKAIKTGEINYAVADLNIDALPRETFNLIYSYEVIVHNDETPGAIVANMWQALTPGGVMYFNAEGSQRQVLADTMADIMEAKGDVLMAPVEPPPLQAIFYKETQQTRDAYRVRKPAR